MTGTRMRRFRASDMTGQKALELEAPYESRVREQKAFLIDKLSLPANDPQGVEVPYMLVNTSRGAILLDSSTFSEVVDEGEKVVVYGEPTAG